MFFYNLKKHEKDGSFTSMMFLFDILPSFFTHSVWFHHAFPPRHPRPALLHPLLQGAPHAGHHLQGRPADLRPTHRLPTLLDHRAALHQVQDTQKGQRCIYQNGTELAGGPGGGRRSSSSGRRPCTPRRRRSSSRGRRSSSRGRPCSRRPRGSLGR